MATSSVNVQPTPSQADADSAIDTRRRVVSVETIGTRPVTRVVMAFLAVIALITTACSSQPTATGGASTAPSASSAASPGASGSAAGNTKHVSILNKDMTDDEIKAEIAKEGSVVVGNWTYTANDELVNQFQQYVKATYGADIKLTYEGSQQPSTYLTKLAAAKSGGNPAPYDVLAIEENYWADAMDQDLVDAVFPSDLIPNASMVLDIFKHDPTTIAFQSTAFPGVVYSKGRAGWMTKLQDLADPRMKGKVVLPPPGDITNGGLFLGLASELGKDYKDVAQMKEVVDWAVANIGPNVLKYTPDSAEMQQLLRSGAADAVSFWNSLARLEYFGGNTDAALLLPAAIYPVNGYLWVPKGAAHPVLAQVFINWRLAKDVQFPNAWPIDHGPWSELSEGFLGPDYVDQIPDWFAKDYFNYFPNLDQIKTFKTVDWKAYNASQKEWQDYYASKIGQ
jgi:spermidine/putrescine-binding protein